MSGTFWAAAYPACGFPKYLSGERTGIGGLPGADADDALVVEVAGLVVEVAGLAVEVAGLAVADADDKLVVDAVGLPAGADDELVVIGLPAGADDELIEDIAEVLAAFTRFFAFSIAEPGSEAIDTSTTIAAHEIVVLVRSGIMGLGYKNGDLSILAKTWQKKRIHWLVAQGHGRTTPGCVI
jgi:hypothetical protein